MLKSSYKIRPLKHPLIIQSPSYRFSETKKIKILSSFLNCVYTRKVGGNLTPEMCNSPRQTWQFLRNVNFFFERFSPCNFIVIIFEHIFHWFNFLIFSTCFLFFLLIGITNAKAWRNRHLFCNDTMQSCSYPFSRQWYKYSVIKLYEIVNVLQESVVINVWSCCGRAGRLLGSGWH